MTTLQHWLDISDDVAESAADTLEDCLATARHRLEDRVIPTAIGTAPVEQAIVMFAARLYHRRNTPEGVVLMGESGSRVPVVDYDVEALIQPYQKWGFA